MVAGVGPFAIAALTALVAVATGTTAPDHLQGLFDWSTWSTVPLLILTVDGPTHSSGAIPGAFAHPAGIDDDRPGGM